MLHQICSTTDPFDLRCESVTYLDIITREKIKILCLAYIRIMRIMNNEVYKGGYDW